MSETTEGVAKGDATSQGASVSGFFHAGVSVSDMDRSLTFYRDALGFELESDFLVEDPYIFRIIALQGRAIRVVFLKIPNSDVRLELLEYQGLERHPGSARPCDPGTGHFCLYVNDVAAMHRKLEAAGFTTRSSAPVEVKQGPRTGAKVIYAIDPDGYHVELFEKPHVAG